MSKRAEITEKNHHHPGSENLTSYKPGEQRAVENGRKGGKVHGRSIKTILKQFMETDPEKIFELSGEAKDIMRGLKKIGCGTTKDLIFWRMTQ